MYRIRPYCCTIDGYDTSGAAEAMAVAGHDLVTHALHPDNVRRCD